MSLVLGFEKKSFPTAPEGLHHAVCVDVHDLGLVENKFKPGTMVRKLWISWMLGERDEEGKPFRVSKSFTASLHEKSSLRKVLRAWRGRDFTADELKSFDLENLIGANCQVQVSHYVKDNGEKGAGVEAVVPPPKGVPALTVPADYIRKKDRDADKAQESAPQEGPATPF